VAVLAILAIMATLFPFSVISGLVVFIRLMTFWKTSGQRLIDWKKIERRKSGKILKLAYTVKAVPLGGNGFFYLRTNH
jgi:type IV secretory pathway TraG/TraD family ATPase VirD4